MALPWVILLGGCAAGFVGYAIASIQAANRRLNDWSQIIQQNNQHHKGRRNADAT